MNGCKKAPSPVHSIVTAQEMATPKGRAAGRAPLSQGAPGAPAWEGSTLLGQCNDGGSSVAGHHTVGCPGDPLTPLLWGERRVQLTVFKRELMICWDGFQSSPATNPRPRKQADCSHLA